MDIEMPPALMPLKEAFRYWPCDKEIYIDSEPPQRFIFSKQSAYTAFEQQQLAALRRLLRERKVNIPENWDDGDLLRYIYAAEFKVHQAAALVRQAIEWRQKVFQSDYRHLYASLRGILCSGFIYIHGRDHVYRPCVILDYTKMSLRTSPLEHYLLAIAFTLEYVVQNILVPGQVETWIVVTDLGRKEIEKVASSDFQKVIEVLQTGFPGRLSANYILNSPDNITQTWAIVRQFLHKETAEKHFTTKKHFSRKMMSQFAPQQVPRRYGGSAPSPNNYWPPVMPSGPFGAPGENQENRLSQKSSYTDFFPDHNLDTEIQEQESIEHGAISVFSDRSLSILEILRAGEKKEEDENQLDVCFVAGEDEVDVQTRLPPSDAAMRDSLSSMGTLGTERLRLKDTLGSPVEEAQRQAISHRRLLATREPALETLLEGQEIVGCGWNCRTCAAQDPTDSFCSIA